MHLHDLLGDGEPEACAALGLGKRAVDLVELVEDPTLLVERYAGAGVGHRDCEIAVPCARGDAHLAGVGEFDGVANEIEQHLGEALFVAEANGERLFGSCMVIIETFEAGSRPRPAWPLTAYGRPRP